MKCTTMFISEHSIYNITESCCAVFAFLFYCHVSNSTATLPVRSNGTFKIIDREAITVNSGNITSPNYLSRPPAGIITTDCVTIQWLVFIARPDINTQVTLAERVPGQWTVTFGLATLPLCIQFSVKTLLSRFKCGDIWESTTIA